LHPLLATPPTPIAAPVIAGTRLRRGSAGSAKGAASFLAEAISTARAAGAAGVLLARMDSAFDNHAVVSTCIRPVVQFSITTKQTHPLRAAIEAISQDAWVPIAIRTRSTTRRAVVHRLALPRVHHQLDT
jgi:hypothetical protein